jgi:hypothetical protein
MAKFTAEIGDVSTAHVKPVVDKSGYYAGVEMGKTIKNVGNLAIDATKGYMISQAESEYEQLATEIKDVDSQYSTADVMAIQDFGKRMEAFQTMAAQGKKADEMKLRAETLLKQQVARMPGLEQEFRKAAANIIGIDPAGQGVKVAFANMAEEEANAERMLTQLQTDSVALGMQVGEIYTEKGQQKYQQLADLRAQMKRSQMELSVYENSAKLGLAKADQVYKAGADGFRQNQVGYTQANAVEANQLVSNFFADRGMNEVSTANIAALSTEDRTALRTMLTSAKNAKYAQYDMISKGFAQRDEYEDISGRILNPFDTMIDVLDGKKTYDDAKFWGDYATQNIVNKISQTPAGQKATIFKELVGNTNLPAGLDAELLSTATKLLGGAVPDPAKPTELPSVPSKEDQQATTKEHVSSMTSVATQVLMDENAPEENKKQVVGMLDNMAQMFEDGDNYKPQVLDEFINTLTNPRTSSVLAKALQSNAPARSSVLSMMAKHTQRSGNSIATQLERMQDRWSMPTDVGNIDGEQSRPFIYPKVEDGKVVLQIDESAVMQWSANNELSENEQKNMMRRVRKDVAKVTAGPISSLNKVVDAHTNLFGKSSDEAAQSVVQRAGRLNNIVQLPLPSREQEMGLGGMGGEPRQVVRGANGQLEFK